MLEDIRKHTGIFIVGLVLIFIGLIFLGDSGSGGFGGRGQVVARGDSAVVHAKDLDKKGERILRLAYRLRDSSIRNGSFQGYLDISGYIENLRYRGQNADPEQIESLAGFVMGRHILEKAIKDYGLQASAEEVKDYVKESLFADRNGLFDQEGYDAFVEEGLSGLGMNLTDFNKFVSELVSYKKLAQLMGAGVQANPKSAEETAMAEGQSLALSVYSLDLETFKKDLKPTDEELKTYWEENKGKYLSEAKRKLTYILATPDFDKMLEEKRAKEAAATETPAAPVANETPTPAESPEPVDATDEEEEEEEEEEVEETSDAAPAETAPAEAAPAEVPTPTATENAETPLPNITGLGEQAVATAPEIILTPAERKKAVDDLGAEMEEIWVELQQIVEGKGQKPDLTKILAKHQFTIKPTPVANVATTELVAQSELPPALRGADRQERSKMLEQKIFDAKTNKAKPMDALSYPLGSGQESWLIFHIDESVDPAEMTFEEAKDKVRVDYIEKKAKEKLTEAINKAREDLAAAIKEGKNATETAASLGLKTTSHENVTQSGSLPGEMNTADLFSLGMRTPTGELSEAELLAPMNDRALFVQVNGRKFVESDANKATISGAAEHQLGILSNSLISHWFQARWEEEKVEFPPLKK